MTQGSIDKLEVAFEAAVNKLQEAVILVEDLQYKVSRSGMPDKMIHRVYDIQYQLTAITDALDHIGTFYSMGDTNG